MRRILAAMGSVAALMGLAGAAHASATIDLIWIDKTDTACTDAGRRDCPQLGSWLSSVFSSDEITLLVEVAAGPGGFVGGGVSVNYGDAQISLSVIDFSRFTTEPYLTHHLGVTSDIPPYINNINAIASPNLGNGIGLPAGQRAYLGTVSFHKDLVVNGYFEISVGTDGPGGTDGLLNLGYTDISDTSTYNSAFIFGADPDFCSIDKKCSVDGFPPQDFCSGTPGVEVTYTYDFVGGSALITDDKLGEIGEWQGQTLTRTTTLFETTTNTAYAEPIDAICLNGNLFDSVTVEIGLPTPSPTATPTATPPTPTPTPTATPEPCQATWGVDSITTIGKGNSPANNLKVSHSITGNIIDPAAVCPDAGACTAHRIPVCAGTGVTIAVAGSVYNTNVGSGVISCNASICTVDAVNVTEKYKSVSGDGKDTDRMILLPQ